MATVQINNTQPIRVDGGGQIIINNGTDDLVVNLHDPGSLVITPGGYDLGEYDNYGAPKVPILRNKLRTDIRLRGRVTTEFSTTDKLAYLSQQIDSTNGLAKTYTFIVKVPNKTDGTTGHTITLANTYFVRPAEYQEGGEFDFLDMVLRSNTHIPVLATY